MKRFRKGAASFYIVAFSTLILVIIATSFATVILSEVTRTTNDDLSQSAYDSALAGVEDAKLAFSNYRRCKAQGVSVNVDSYRPDVSNNTVTCSDIVYWMEKTPKDCDMVAHILGRIGKGENSEVMVSDTTSTSGNGEVSMNQAYTCVKIETDLTDYRANLSSSNKVKVVAASFEDAAIADRITAIRVRWYAVRETEGRLNYGNFNGNLVEFRPINVLDAVTPPTIGVSMIQTVNSFKLTDFDITNAAGNTNRAMVYLVPSSSIGAVNAGSSYTTHVGTYNATYRENIISAAQVAATNARTKNLPFGVYCSQDYDEEFACSATINLPRPVPNGGDTARSNDTFTFMVSLPYEQPDTDFSITFLCGNSACSESSDRVGGSVVSIAKINGVQVLIDSTGRANDLYRRVETRLESTDTSFPYQYYALELLDANAGNDKLFEKNMTVTSQY